MILINSTVQKSKGQKCMGCIRNTVHRQFWGGEGRRLTRQVFPSHSFVYKPGPKFKINGLTELQLRALVLGMHKMFKVNFCTNNE